MQAPRQRGIELLGGTGPQLFLSHSSANAKVVAQLAQDLNICGVDVWLDAWEFRVGDDLHQRIADAMPSRGSWPWRSATASTNSSGCGGKSVRRCRARRPKPARGAAAAARGRATSPLLGSKKFLDFTPKANPPSLARLVGLTHHLDTQAVEAGINAVEPHSVREAIRALHFTGFELLRGRHEDTRGHRRAGGEVSGNMVRFDPETVLRDPRLSPAVRELVRRLMTEW